MAIDNHRLNNALDCLDQIGKWSASRTFWQCNQYLVRLNEVYHSYEIQVNGAYRDSHVEPLTEIRKTATKNQIPVVDELIVEFEKYHERLQMLLERLKTNIDQIREKVRAEKFVANDIETHKEAMTLIIRDFDWTFNKIFELVVRAQGIWGYAVFVRRE